MRAALQAVTGSGADWTVVSVQSWGGGLPSYFNLQEYTLNRLQSSRDAWHSTMR
jgi:hypothetical protein